MPTGYTAKLAEGEQTFQEFAMTCARAFGALVNMRDEDMDAPIPESFEPSNYYLAALKEANAELQRLSDMKKKDRLEFGKEAKELGIAQIKNSMAEAEKRDARYSAMQDQVSEWVPPTPEHEGMKKFMLEQLEISKDNMGDYYKNQLLLAEIADPFNFFYEALKGAMDAVKWRGESVQEEEEQCRKRAEWVRELRKSLGVS